MSIPVFLVDDEPHAVRSIRALINDYTEGFEVVGEANSVPDAIKGILKTKPKVVFLDIEMGDGTGFEVLEATKSAGYIPVFGTAHENYAIKAIRAEAFDYLVKPIEINEFIRTTERIKDELSKTKSTTSEELEKSNISIPTETGFESIRIKDILYLRADGSYTEMELESGRKLLVSRKLGQFEAGLPRHAFFRINHSIIANMEHITSYNRYDNSLELGGGTQLLVSRRRKEEFLEALSAFTNFI